MSFRKNIFSIKTDEEFSDLSLEVFRYQLAHNKIYKKYVELLGKDPTKVSSNKEIPFLPISFFKSHALWAHPGPTDKAEAIFTSSGTAGTQSKHYVAELNLYVESFRKGFEYFFGQIKGCGVLALLPSYLEREGSSLIYMVRDFIRQSACDDSGFFLSDHEHLLQILKSREAAQKKTLLIGVSFALLDFVEKYPIKLKHTLVMETGGMKGRRKEMIREELHDILKKGFSVKNILSEYGMSELLSQAYSKGGGLFSSPPWMRVFIRDLEDPFAYVKENATGGINIVDLANYNSCSFISTEDLGRYVGGSFEVLGRFDFSELRGCNLLI